MSKEQNHGPTDLDQTLQEGASPKENLVDDASNTLDFYDMTLQSLVAVKKELSKKHKKSYFFGVVVAVDEITVDECEAETSTSFVLSLVNNKIGKKNVTQLKKVRVYIPELQGFLPMLNRNQVIDYHKNKAEEASKPMHEYYKRTLSRITPFYTSGESPEIVSSCRVEFSDENNMFFGRYLENAGGG